MPKAPARQEAPRAATGPWTVRLSEKVIGGRRLPQWQHEISSSGRVFYCPDRTHMVVWVTRVDLAHPKQTD